MNETALQRSDPARVPSREPWLQMLEPNPEAELNLVCFPFAGGSAAVFRGWGAALGTHVEIWPVQPPGRGPRLREAPLRRVPEIVDGVVDALLPRLDRPFALFGHSLGALLAFEVARELRRRNAPAPRQLIVSAAAAPSTRVRLREVHTLPENELIDEIARLDGTPKEVHENLELMRLVLPAFRADFEAYATYVHRDESPLACPISVVGGARDELVRPGRLRCWQRETTGSCRIRMLPGGHFFIVEERDSLLELVADELSGWKPTSG